MNNQLEKTTTSGSHPALAQAQSYIEVLEAVKKIAEYYYSAGMVPKSYINNRDEDPEKRAIARMQIAMAQGMGKGLTPQQSLDYYYIVAGRPSVFGEGIFHHINSHPRVKPGSWKVEILDQEKGPFLKSNDKPVWNPKYGVKVSAIVDEEEKSYTYTLKDAYTEGIWYVEFKNEMNQWYRQKEDRNGNKQWVRDLWITQPSLKMSYKAGGIFKKLYCQDGMQVVDLDHEWNGDEVYRETVTVSMDTDKAHEEVSVEDENDPRMLMKELGKIKVQKEEVPEVVEVQEEVNQEPEVQEVPETTEPEVQEKMEGNDDAWEKAQNILDNYSMFLTTFSSNRVKKWFRTKKSKPDYSIPEKELESVQGQLKRAYGLLKSIYDLYEEGAKETAAEELLSIMLDQENGSVIEALASQSWIQELKTIQLESNES